MGFNYLNEKGWADISREERYFCSHLYHSLLHEDNKRAFLNLLKDKNSPAGIIPLSSLSDIDVDDEWEVGFEVCFYRDVLIKYNISVKKNDMEIKDKEKMIKRTFDLCIFSKDSMIIIEAKCLSNLDNTQYGDFGLDKMFINEMYDYLNSKGMDIKPPEKIYTVFLAPSGYYNSASFTKSNGMGKKIIAGYLNNQNLAAFRFDKFISWGQMEGLPVKPSIDFVFKRANSE